MPCPYCQNPTSTQVGFTWWGGLIGAKLLSHVECTACHRRYNGRTGQSNNGSIALYMTIIGVIGFAVIYVVLQQ